MTELRFIRDVPKTEEGSFADKDFKMTDVVYYYRGFTYGCLGKGIAVTEVDGETPFFEMPRDAFSN